jgi:hypothetical protein
MYQHTLQIQWVYKTRIIEEVVIFLHKHERRQKFRILVISKLMTIWKKGDHKEALKTKLHESCCLTVIESGHEGKWENATTLIPPATAKVSGIQSSTLNVLESMIPKDQIYTTTLTIKT